MILLMKFKNNKNIVCSCKCEEDFDARLKELLFIKATLTQVEGLEVVLGIDLGPATLAVVSAQGASLSRVTPIVALGNHIKTEKLSY